MTEQRRRPKYVTQEEFYEAMEELNERLEAMSTGEQVDIDALAAEVQSQGATISQVALNAASAATQLQTEMDNLEALVNSGTPPAPSDLSALRTAIQANTAALAPLTDAMTALGQTVPTPPAEPPAEPAA